MRLEEGILKHLISMDCFDLVTNSSSPGFMALISKLVDLLQIAIDVHYGTFCTFREKIDDQNDTSSPQLTYTSMCFDPAKYEKLDHDVLSKTSSLSNVMLWIALQKK